MKSEEKREKRLMMMRAVQRADDADDGKMIVEGYAAIFRSPTVLWKSSYSGTTYLEQIEPEAFDNTNMDETVLNFNHGDAAMVLASARNKTLVMQTDAKGLKITAEIADTTAGRDIYALIKRGDLDKMSFAFDITSQTIEENSDDKTCLRKITGIGNLYDVSVVPFPAYDDTSITARAKECFIAREAEERERRHRLALLAL